MVITLCDGLLQTHGYQVAIAWWCLERSLDAGDGSTISEDQWLKMAMPMQWREFIGFLPQLLSAQRIHQVEQVDQSNYRIERQPIGKPCEWGASRHVQLNLKQHGIHERDISGLERGYREAVVPGQRNDEAFVKWALRKHYSSVQGDKPLVIDRNWEPTPTVVSQLIKEGVPESFIADKVPEFRLYWREMGVPRASYQQTFVSYLKKLWLEGAAGEVSIDEWSPSPVNATEASRFGGERGFAELEAEFRVYWRDVGKKFECAKWNALFEEFVSKQPLRH